MANMGNEKTVADTDVWLTPPRIIESLGQFDLDPCSPLDRPWDTAKKHYTIEDDGLVQSWEGRVWMNPPYGPPMPKWLEKLANHPGGGIALTFARTETKAFHEFVWDKADALLFLRGRLKFHRSDGIVSKKDPGSPSVLIAYGKENVKALENCELDGKIVYLTK
jgi:hypothetical protein